MKHQNSRWNTAQTDSSSRRKSERSCRKHSVPWRSQCYEAQWTKRPTPPLKNSFPPKNHLSPLIYPFWPLVVFLFTSYHHLLIIVFHTQPLCCRMRFQLCASKSSLNLTQVSKRSKMGLSAALMLSTIPFLCFFSIYPLFSRVASAVRKQRRTAFRFLPKIFCTLTTYLCKIRMSSLIATQLVIVDQPSV